MSFGTVIRRPLLSAILAVSALFGLSAQAQTVRIGMGAIPPNVDPHSTLTAPATIAYNAIFDALTRIRTDVVGGDVEPALAESWEQVEPTVWEFRLRQDVTFQNGEPFDASDVKATFDRILDPENTLPIRGRVETITNVEIVDDYTIRVTTNGPDPILPKRMAVGFVLPPSAFEMGDEFFENPVGTGPWRLAEFVADEVMVLEAVESWRGTPELEAIRMIAMPESSVRVAALRTGEIDIVHKLPTDQAVGLESEGFAVEWVGEAGTYLVDLYMPEGPLSDVRVRQAINYAVDMEGLLEFIMNGYGVLSQAQVVAPNSFGFDPELDPYPYDPERAMELLAEAGYPNGFEVEFQTPRGFVINDEQLAEAIVGYLAAVGIEADLTVLEYSVFLDTWYQDRAPEGNRSPLFAWRLALTPFMDGDAALQYYQCDYRPHNISYCNEEVHEVFQRSRVEMDPEARAELLHQMSAMLKEDAPVLFGFHPPELYGSSPSITGFEPRADGVIWFDTIGKE